MPPPDPSGQYLGEELEIDSNWNQIIDDFDKMGLKDDILRGIYAYGLEKPSPVQQRAIIPLLKGRNLIIQAQSGTGKTAAFVIPILQKLDISLKKTQALILTPTRELAQQIQKAILDIGQYMNFKCYVCIGGRKVSNDRRALEGGVHVVVGTPGRVRHLLRDKILEADNIKLLCIDEADELLSHKGERQTIKGKFRINSIMKQLPRQDKQTILLSATIRAELLREVTNGMKKPVKILVKTGQLTLEGIQQYFVYLEGEAERLETLCDLYNNETFAHPTVVFLNTRNGVNDLFDELSKRQISVSATHGKKLQTDREALLRAFREGSSRVLITTDMLARGIDVQQVAIVINYQLPDLSKIQLYLHRIGRCGRFGRKGIAINLVTKNDIQMLRSIEKHYGTQIEEMPADISSLVRRLSLADKEAVL